jgi:phosphoribosyl-ATP pyrophosphohydrolase
LSRAEILDRLQEVIAERKRGRPEGSYVVSLLDSGLPAIVGKIREEAEELIEAAGEGDPAHTAHEAADLLFHVWVLLAEVDLPAEQVYEELARRFGIGGLEEKASRDRSK